MNKTSTNTVAVTGSHGRSDELRFYPEQLAFIRDKTRLIYDPRVELPVDEDLVRNIEDAGEVIQAIKVRRNGDAIEIVIGNQRVKATAVVNERRRKAGKEPLLLPAKLVRGDDRDIYFLIVSENEQRNETPPVMRAQQANKLLKFGYPEEEVMRAFRYTSATGFKKLLALLDLDETVQNMVDVGKFSSDLAATTLVSFPREQQVEEMNKILAAGSKGEIAKVTLQQRLEAHRANGVADAGKEAKDGKTPKKKAKAAPEPEEPVARVRTRRQVEKLLAGLKASGEVDGEMSTARALCSWFLGSDRAFTKAGWLAEYANPKED